MLYSRSKLKDGELRSFKRVLNDFQFDGCLVFQETIVYKNNPDETVLSKVFARENISCKSPTELRHYSWKAFKEVCIQCGKLSKLIVDLNHFPQCERCKGIEKIKINNRKKTIESGLVANKKVKNSDSFFNISFRTKKKSLFIFIIFFVIVKNIYFV